MGTQSQPGHDFGSGHAVSSGFRRWVVFLPAALAVVMVVSLSFGLLLPSLFPYSDAVVLGLAAGALALGLGLMLPEGWMYSETARLAHAFKTYHGVSGDRAEVALSAVSGAHDAATRLRQADNGFRDDLAALAREAAGRLDDVARLIFYKPDQLPKYQALVIRAQSVIDAVEDHAKVRARAVSDTEIAKSRDMAQAGLTRLHEALDASQHREVAAILGRIEANVATAETLLRPRN